MRRKSALKCVAISSLLLDSVAFCGRSQQHRSVGRTTIITKRLDEQQIFESCIHSLHSDRSSFSSVSSSSALRPRAAGITRQYSSSKDNDNDKEGSLPAASTTSSLSSRARVRFSGTQFMGRTGSLSAATANDDPIDSLLSLLTSDIGSIVVGLLGILALLVGRLILDANLVEIDTDVATTTTAETRSNLLALCATGAILLNGISKLNVESALATPVSLVGTIPCSEPVVRRKDGQKQKDEDTLVMVTGIESSIQWAMKSLLATNNPAQTVVLLGTMNQPDERKWEILAISGCIPSPLALEGGDNDVITDQNAKTAFDSIAVPDNSPILDRFRSERQRETYLPTLQALPGKAEFTYLAPNTQAALILPVIRVVPSTLSSSKDNGTPSSYPSMVLVLGSNQARSFTPRDIAWGQAIAARVGDEWSRTTGR